MKTADNFGSVQLSTEAEIKLGEIPHLSGFFHTTSAQVIMVWYRQRIYSKLRSSLLFHTVYRKNNLT